MHTGEDSKLSTFIVVQELFTEYFRRDGMIRRIHIFEDEERMKLIERQEFFANRKDLLLQRNVYPLKGCTHEMFDRGRRSEMKDHILFEGVKREMHFYPGNRIDGMVKRELLFGKKVACLVISPPTS